MRVVGGVNERHEGGARVRVVGCEAGVNERLEGGA